MSEYLDPFIVGIDVMTALDVRLVDVRNLMEPGVLYRRIDPARCTDCAITWVDTASAMTLHTEGLWVVSEQRSRGLYLRSLCTRHAIDWSDKHPSPFPRLRPSYVRTTA